MKKFLSPIALAFALGFSGVCQANLTDFAGTYKGSTLTTFTETTPPTYTKLVTVKVKPKGKSNAGKLLLSWHAPDPTDQTTSILVTLSRNGSGSALVNNPDAGVSNLTIPWNAKIKGKSYSVTSSFLLFDMCPTNVAMNLKVHGNKLVGNVAFTRLDTGAQVVTANFTIKKQK
jgi:hypothetical protein